MVQAPICFQTNVPIIVFAIADEVEVEEEEAEAPPEKKEEDEGSQQIDILFVRIE